MYNILTKIRDHHRICIKAKWVLIIIIIRKINNIRAFRKWANTRGLDLLFSNSLPTANKETYDWRKTNEYIIMDFLRRQNNTTIIIYRYKQRKRKVTEHEMKNKQTTTNSMIYKLQQTA